MITSKYGYPLAFLVLTVIYTFAFKIPTDSKLSDFLELSQKILNIYKDPQNAKTEDLMDAANDYLCELCKLRMGLRINSTGSADIMMQVYLEGNPPFHTRNVPWDKFIKYLGWSDTQLTKYEDVISDTRRIWRESLEELEKYKDPDVIL